jgi:hypothetical protein
MSSGSAALPISTLGYGLPKMCAKSLCRLAMS